MKGEEQLNIRKEATNESGSPSCPQVCSRTTEIDSISGSLVRQAHVDFERLIDYTQWCAEI